MTSDIIVSALSRDEALTITREINAQLHEINARMITIREKALIFYERQGFRALGYKSFAEYAKAELHCSSATVYREVTAGVIERELTGHIGKLPKSQLNALTELASSDRADVWQAAVSSWVAFNPDKPPIPSAGWVRAAVQVFNEARATGVVSASDDPEKLTAPTPAAYANNVAQEARERILRRWTALRKKPEIYKGKFVSAEAAAAELNRIKFAINETAYTVFITIVKESTDEQTRQNEPGNG